MSIKVDGYTQTWDNPNTDGSGKQAVKINTFDFTTDAFAIALKAFGISVSDFTTNNEKASLPTIPLITRN